jgi:hypothetical protein
LGAARESSVHTALRACGWPGRLSSNTVRRFSERTSIVPPWRTQDRTSDREAQPGTVAEALPGGIRTVEGIEQPRQVLGGDRLAGIFDRQPNPGLRRLRQTNSNPAARRGMPDGVREQVVDGPAQHQPVARNQRSPGAGEGNLLFLGKRLVEFEQALHFRRRSTCSRGE